MLIGPKFSTKLFNYDASTRTFSAEASDFGNTPFFGQLWDDACDEGLVLVSHNTGNEEGWYLHKEVRDNFVDGDIQYWEFRSVKPKFSGFKVIIFND